MASQDSRRQHRACHGVRHAVAITGDLPVDPGRVDAGRVSLRVHPADRMLAAVRLVRLGLRLSRRAGDDASRRRPERLSRSGRDLVEVTGGEPLEQEGVYPLMERLLDAGKTVLLETGGHVPLDRVDPRVVKIVDVKAPGQRHAGTRTCRENLENARAARRAEVRPRRTAATSTGRSGSSRERGPRPRQRRDVLAGLGGLCRAPTSPAGSATAGGASGSASSSTSFSGATCPGR